MSGLIATAVWYAFRSLRKSRWWACSQNKV